VKTRLHLLDEAGLGMEQPHPNGNGPRMLMPAEGIREECFRSRALEMSCLPSNGAQLLPVCLLFFFVLFPLFSFFLLLLPLFYWRWGRFKQCTSATLMMLMMAYVILH
jgi:hypothetical protein